MNNTENTPEARTDKAIAAANSALATAQAALATAKNIQAAQASRYEGWSRFFLCTNTGGHIHSSTACSTCTPTTQFAWITDLSGKTEAEAVTEHGEILCSVCFPTAPVAWTNGISNEAKANRAAAAEAKEARDIEATAKAQRLADRDADILAAVADAEAALESGTFKLVPTVAKLVAANEELTITEPTQSIYNSRQLAYSVLWNGHTVAKVSQSPDGKLKGLGRMLNFEGGGGQAQAGKLADLKAWVAEQVEDMPGKNFFG
jgi:Skp family chaperone for outer membrane proteins